MIKKYQLKIDPEENCFICGDKTTMSFDKEALKFILELPLCLHHTSTIKTALAKFDRPENDGSLIE